MDERMCRMEDGRKTKTNARSGERGREKKPKMKRSYPSGAKKRRKKVYILKKLKESDTFLHCACGSGQQQQQPTTEGPMPAFALGPKFPKSSWLPRRCPCPCRLPRRGCWPCSCHPWEDPATQGDD